MDVEGEGIGTPAEMAEDQQAAVIADVATDPDPSGSGSSAPIVLEVGVGRIDEVYVVAPIVDIDGKTVLQLCKGGVFSFYEFHWPADDRLTDEKWRELLDAGNAPAGPEWISSFKVAERAYSDLSNAIGTYEEDLTYIYWDPVYSLENLSPALEPFRGEIEKFWAIETIYWTPANECKFSVFRHSI